MLFETGNRDKEVNKSRNITPQVPQQIFIWLQWEEQKTNREQIPNLDSQKNYTVYILADKRSSTGNLFFTDQFDNHPWEAPPELQPPGHKAGAWPQQRRRNLSSLSQDQAGAGAGNKEAEDRDPAATLQAMAGELQRNEYSTLVYLNLINWSQIVVSLALLTIITSSLPVTPLLNAVLPHITAHTKDHKVIKCKNIFSV